VRVGAKKTGSIPSSWMACYQVPEEKMTDVNIAVEMMGDAQRDGFDTALLVFADSGLTPPVERIKELHKDKKVVAAFPSMRSSKRLASVVDANFRIGRGKLSKSLLPENVAKSDGVVISRASRWEENRYVPYSNRGPR
jgi:NYN domain-containing protein